MSTDSEESQHSSLLKQLQIMERKYKRERGARLQAESILTKRSQQLYEANQKLEQHKNDLEQEIVSRTREIVATRDEAIKHAQAKSEFLANMSHEIRTPLNGVLGMLYSLRKCKSDFQRNSLIQAAIQSGKLLITVINDILDYSKIDSVGVTLEDYEFDLRHTLETVAHNFASNARKKNLDIITIISPDIPNSFNGDGHKIQQVVGNLLSNAIKFTDEGVVVLSAEYEQESGVTIRITDTGIGIHADKMKSLFEAFSQSDSSVTRKYGGTGLGLAISASYIQAMDSTLEVASIPGKGSEFFFTLPANIADNATLSDAYSAKLSNKHIVVLTNSNQYQTKLRKLLATTSIAALHVCNNFDEVDFTMLKQQDSVHFFFDLSHMSNADRARIPTISSKLPNQKVICIALENYEDIIGDAEDADYHLLKPVRTKELFQAIAGESIFRYTETLDVDSDAKFTDVAALVVDDNPINLQVASAMLVELGCRVVTCDSGIKALDIVKQAQFDIVFMDIQMPGLDGITTMQKLKALPEFNASIPIVAMTAHSREEDRAKHLSCGMAEHLSKPIAPEPLAQTIINLLKLDGVYADSVKPDSSNDINIPSIPGVDLKTPLINMNGRLTLLHSLLSSFIAKYSSAPDTLSEYIANNDLSLAAALAHTLKGTGGNLGLNAISSIAAKIESELKANRIPDGPLMNEIIDAFTVLPRLMDWINEKAQPESDVSKERCKSSLAESLQHLSDSIYQDNVRSLELVHMCMNSFPQFKAQFVEIKQAIDDFDLVLAEQLTTDLLKDPGIMS